MMNSPINMFVCHIDGVVLTVNIAIILFEYSPFYRNSRSSFVMSLSKSDFKNFTILAARSFRKMSYGIRRSKNCMNAIFPI